MASAKKIEVISDSLTNEQFKTLSRVAKDPLFFSQFAYVIHPVRGKVRFDLYHYQKVVLTYFMIFRFNIILKFRQAGVTELLALYALWFAMYNPNKNIQIISIKDRVAKRFLKKIKFFYKNLPDYLKVPIVNGRSGDLGTATEIEFLNGSIITSIPTTEDAGRSEAASLLIIDEAAIIRWANKIWAAAFPTLSTGGSALIASTPFGVGNWYHQMWVDAVAGNKGIHDFNPIRLTWDMHPERDIEWYKTMSHKLGPKRTAQEIDGDFLSSGNTVFDLADIREIEELADEVNPWKTFRNGSVIYIRPPKPGEQCALGADVASGRARDYSAFSVMNRAGEELAYFKGKISIDQYAELLMRTATDYNNALLGPESNDIGLAVTKLCQTNGYQNLYYSERVLKEKGKTKPKIAREPGWYTTRKNRGPIIDELEYDIRNNDVELRNKFFCQEAYTFIYDSTNRPVAMGKENKNGTSDDLELGEDDYTDDSILAEAITNNLRKGRLRNIIISPQ